MVCLKLRFDFLELIDFSKEIQLYVFVTKVLNKWKKNYNDERNIKVVDLKGRQKTRSSDDKWDSDYSNIGSIITKRKRGQQD